MDFAKELYKKIWILDGAYGTRFQALELEEDAYRSRLLRDHPTALKGNYDLLNLSAPEAVRKIHD